MLPLVSGEESVHAEAPFQNKRRRRKYRKKNKKQIITHGKEELNK